MGHLDIARTVSFRCTMAKVSNRSPSTQIANSDFRWCREDSSGKVIFRGFETRNCGLAQNFRPPDAHPPPLRDLGAGRHTPSSAIGFSGRPLYGSWPKELTNISGPNPPDFLGERLAEIERVSRHVHNVHFAIIVQVCRDVPVRRGRR